ncbi:hypothetical protein TNCV_3223021 [Trichonephila clavipes]|nr:hypothetical protein TNCV_3223021 [Trichonephila clavipes]
MVWKVTWGKRKKEVQETNGRDCGATAQRLDFYDKRWEILAIGCVAAGPEIGKIVELRSGFDILSCKGCGAAKDSCQNNELNASPGPVNTDIELLMTGNTLPGLASLVSNSIELKDVYGNGDNLMNPYGPYMPTKDCSSWWRL